MLRTLRPLRFISHNTAMKVVVTALLNSIGAILNVVVVILLVWYAFLFLWEWCRFMFAIFGVSLLAGKFQYCAGNPDFVYTVGTEEECMEVGGHWKSYDSNFDNTIQAILSLFIVSSLEGWPDIMFHACDTTAIGTVLYLEFMFN